MLKSLLSMFNIKKSIRAKIFVFFPIIFIIGFSITTFIWQKNVQVIIQDKTISHITDVIKVSNMQFEQELIDLDKTVNSIASDELYIKNNLKYNSSDAGDKITSYLSGYYNLLNDSIYGIAVVDFDKSIYKKGAPYVPTDYKNNSWVQTILSRKGKGTFIIRNSEENAGNSYITVGCAIMDKETPIGIVIIDTKPSIFIRSFGINLVNGTLSSAVVDNNHSLVFCNNYQISKDDINNALNICESENSFMKAFDYQIKDVTYITMAYKSSYTSWTNLTFLKRSIIEKSYKTTIKQTFIIEIILLLIIIFISTIISYEMTKKLHMLHNQISEFDLNNNDSYDKFIPIITDDEIGTLSVKFLQLIKKISCQLNEVAQLEKQKRKYEICTLEAQINPHFLYNTLNTIRHLAIIQKIENIEIVSTSLIDLLKYSVGNDNDYVTLSDEINYIKNYMEIMQFKSFNVINMSYDIEEDVLCCKTIKMILQPIVENSIKHGLRGKSTDYIIIKAYKSEDVVEIKISDNGRGISPEKINDILSSDENYKHGIGLRNLNNRIKLYYGERYGLRIFSIPDIQTSIIITIPYIK